MPFKQFRGSHLITVGTTNTMPFEWNYWSSLVQMFAHRKPDIPRLLFLFVCGEIALFRLSWQLARGPVKNGCFENRQRGKVRRALSLAKRRFKIRSQSLSHFIQRTTSARPCLKTHRLPRYRQWKEIGQVYKIRGLSKRFVRSLRKRLPLRFSENHC